MTEAAACPRFPLLEEPGTWDRLTLLAATVALEAEGEPEDGQLAVAFVATNRARLWTMSLHAVILGPDQRAYDDARAFEAFSCWNDDYRVRAGARLATLGAFEPAWRAAARALWPRDFIADDPSRGATYYLNVPLTRKLRPARDLPAWFDAAKVTVMLGQHTFLRG